MGGGAGFHIPRSPSFNAFDKQYQQVIEFICRSALQKQKSPNIAMDKEIRPAGLPPMKPPLIFKPKACVGCRARKVKCDRETPCSNCIRWSVACTYPSPVRTCSRPSKKQLNETEPKSQRDLMRIPSPALWDPDISIRICKPPMVSSPLLSRAQTCWRIFVERVDPVVKVLHRTSAERDVVASACQPESLRDNEEALVHAIYFASIASMTSEEAQRCFHTSKNTALTAYSYLVEQSIARAAFLLDDELSTLQALVLFLTINRLCGKPSVAWKLTGLAKRSGVFRKSDLTIYEREMKARLWWNLWYLDHRAVMDLGEEDVSGKETYPELPLNIDDADLDPHATKAPTPLEGWTEATFALVRFEIAMTRRQLHEQLDLNRKERLIQACETRIHDLYLRHSIETKPIQWLTQHVVHVLIMEMWFELYSADTIPLNSWSQHVQDRLFLLAIDIVDVSARLRTEPQSQQWTWLLTGYQQYRPLAFLLNELCYREECEAVDHAWKVVENAVTRWPDQVRASMSGKVLAGLRQRARRVQLQITQRQYSGEV